MVLYIVALLASIATWFIPYRAPLWLDETVSYWEISGGFGQIWSRTVEGLSFPAYFYVLWLTRELFGSREVILRIPSVLAMLAAVYVLYRIAREFLDVDVSVIVCILFCLHNVVAFAAIDVRPYSFAMLATVLAIYALILWTRRPDTRHSVLLGALCAFIFCFHYLYGVILPAFVACYFVLRGSSLRKDLRQIAIVLATFLFVFLPVIPRLLYILSRRNSYSFAPPPSFGELLLALSPSTAPLLPIVILALVVLLAALIFQAVPAPGSESRRALLFALVLAVAPTGILFAVSLATPLQIFVERYRLVGVVGIVLFWGCLLNLIRSAPLRLLFCLVLVPFSIFSYWDTFDAHRHGYTWKAALEYAQFVAAPDQAKVLICSDLPQADFEPMPVGRAADSVLFAPLSYYKVSVPVVPLPRALTPETKRIGSEVLRQSAERQQRFLLLAYGPSLPTAQWLNQQAAGSFSVQVLGVLDGILVAEFRPLARANDGARDQPEVGIHR